MRLLLYGKDVDDIKPLLDSFRFDVVRENPDAVICYGGDGTLLHAEHAYPGVLKLPVRNSKVCKLCANVPNEDIFERLKRGAYGVQKIMKLGAVYDGTEILALNDVIVSHAIATRAIRYTIGINGKPYAGGREIIGDGVVVATPFGSGGYYRSITDSVFSVGIGLAFNNSTEQVDHVVLKESDSVTFTLTRGEAVFAGDVGELKKIVAGEAIVVRASKDQFANIVSFGEEFRYWSE